MNYPKICEIKDTKKEAHKTKTIFFDYPVVVKPGQFFMVWIPGVDEIPMSVSHIDKDVKGISFRIVGEATQSLYNMKKGDKIGVRGPYGNGFALHGKKILVVGGGTGIVMIPPIVEEAHKKKIHTIVVLGAKKKDELFFEKEIKNTKTEMFITTNDGSKGYKGLATDLAKEILAQEKFDLIVTCGPEIMMKKLMDMSGKIGFQASLERYMKCGFGICGQCCVGKGLRVCQEGPVFDRQTLERIEDFGKYKRDASGKKIQI